MTTNLTPHEATPARGLCLLLGLTLAFAALAAVPSAAAFCVWQPDPVLAYRVCNGSPDLVHVWVLGEDFGDPLP